jgi:hypothetical protein
MKENTFIVCFIATGPTILHRSWSKRTILMRICADPQLKSTFGIWWIFCFCYRKGNTRIHIRRSWFGSRLLWLWRHILCNLSAYLPDESPHQVLQRSAGFCRTTVSWDYRGNQVHTLNRKGLSFTFYNKFVEIYKLFPCKTAYYERRQKIFTKFLLKIMLFMV